MSIPRTNAGNWAVGDALTSAQANSLDTSITYATDKRSGQSDTVQSTLTLASPGSLTCATGSSLVIASGATASISNTTNVTGGGALLQTLSGGRIQLGDNDYPQFSAVRSYTRMFSSGNAIGGNWSASAVGNGVLFTGAAVGQAMTSTATGAQLVLSLPGHNGATITNATVYFMPTTGHVGSPALWPLLNVVRLDPSIRTIVSLNSGGDPNGAVAYTGFTTLAAYNDQTVVKTISFTPNQNSVMDTTHAWQLVFTDENGANSRVGTQVLGFAVTYSSIADMRFQ